MNDEHVAADIPETESPRQGGDAHRTTRIFLIILAILLAWYVFADRITPYTSAARVKGYVIPIVPDVAGYITEIPVKKYYLAQAGDKLLQIDPRRFELALREAEAALDVVGQEVGGGTEAVATAAAEFTQAKVELDEATTQAARLYTLEQKGIVPRAQGDQARAVVATSKAKLAAAEAELSRVKKTLGVAG